MIEDLPPLEPKPRVSSYEILMGTSILPIDRLKLLNDKEFEILVLEWATEYLSQRYYKVRNIGSAGDKGRDVIGYHENGIDVYQCKYYAAKIHPNKVYVELGKLCYYTYKEIYAIPKNYIIVSPRGVGGTLFDLINAPLKLKSQLIKNWKTHCSKKITSKQVIELEGSFKDYVENFDFSIVSEKSPDELIKEYAQTSYYDFRFGRGLKKFRSSIPEPSNIIDSRELLYISQLFNIYNEKTGNSINDFDSLNDPELVKHFNEQRNSFYSAESLELFSRDNFPDVKILPFDELKEDCFMIVNTSLTLNDSQPGWFRLESSVQELLRQSFVNNPLSIEMRPLDKRGMANYIANENLIKWVK